ncbi:hypothetical protein L3Y34_003209 [Caenorhabditis briggsae]|uniref:Uncharacterized protein n=1 Tax=Caenorhabditis briggsae TaxID=6238 RepID=A0AAE9ABW8_CAEBR|nr:hypothetical protein L3Y34_003209 [Caenorhabditis briggsae]
MFQTLVSSAPLCNLKLSKLPVDPDFVNSEEHQTNEKKSQDDRKGHTENHKHRFDEHLEDPCEKRGGGGVHRWVVCRSRTEI